MASYSACNCAAASSGRGWGAAGFDSCALTVDARASATIIAAPNEGPSRRRGDVFLFFMQCSGTMEVMPAEGGEPVW